MKLIGLAVTACFFFALWVFVMIPWGYHAARVVIDFWFGG